MRRRPVTGAVAAARAARAESGRYDTTNHHRRRARRRRLAPGRVARSLGSTRRAVQRRLLDRPRPHGRTRGRRLPHDRGRARPAVLGVRRRRRSHRPGARPARRPAHRLAHRAGDEPHRPRADGDDHPHRAVPRRDRPADARLREPRPGRLARAGLGRGARGPPLRPAQRSPPLDLEAARRGDSALVRELFDEAARRRRGRAPALGQLGGRRDHPGCRHRPVRRPRQAALRRLRGRRTSR